MTSGWSDSGWFVCAMPANRPSREESQESGEVLEDAGSAGVEIRSEECTTMPAEEQEQGKRTQKI